MSWCKSVEKFNSGNKICKYSSACVWKSPRFNVAFVQLENLVKIRQIDFNRSKKFATQSVTSHAVARYLLAWCWTSSRLEWWSTRGACGPGRAQPPGGWPGFRGFCCSGFPLLTCCLGPPGLEEAATVVVSQPSEWVSESEWMNECALSGKITSLLLHTWLTHGPKTSREGRGVLPTTPCQNTRCG